MYSLRLMATLTTPATTIDSHKNRCSGCYGSCSCSCYGGCNGSSCSGRCSGCFGSRSRSSCSGCYGSSCYGSACYGSSCYGSACTGSSCSGCYGSAYYYTGSCWGGHSCYGCSGSSCAGSTGAHTSAYPPSYEHNPAAPAVTFNTTAAPARVSISLPADAKLYVDGQLTRTLDKSFRTFATPDLENGQEYRYVMKAEVVRNGVVQSETKTVVVKAGAEVREEFSSLNDIATASNK